MLALDIKPMFKEDVWEVINGSNKTSKNFFKIIGNYVFGKTFEETEKIVEELQKKYEDILNKVNLNAINKDLLELIKSAEQEFKEDIEPLLREIEGMKNGSNCNDNHP